MRRIVPPRLALLALSHCTIDAYSSFFSPLLPLLVTRLHLSLARVGTVVGRLGLDHTYVAAIPGVLMAIVLLTLFARLDPRPRRVGPRPAFVELRPVARPLVLLYFAVACRSAVSYGFMTFLPIHLSQ